MFWLIEKFFAVSQYFFYRCKYRLPMSFRFNGIFIRIHGNGDLVVGENTYISHFTYLNVIEGAKLELGSGVQIAHNVKIYTSGFDTEKRALGLDNEYVADVSIGDGCLIGSNAYICPGVTLGKNVVVGANSVVTTNFPDYTVVAGVPARIVKNYA